MIKAEMADLGTKLDNVQTEVDKKFQDVDKKFEDVDIHLTGVRRIADATYKLLNDQLKLKAEESEAEALGHKMAGVEQTVQELQVSQVGFFEQILKALGLGGHRDSKNSS